MEKESSRISELSAVNKLWKASYKKLEGEYEGLLESNAKLYKTLEQTKRDRDIYFGMAMRYTEILNGVKTSMKSYGIPNVEEEDYEDEDFDL